MFFKEIWDKIMSFDGYSLTVRLFKLIFCVLIVVALFCIYGIEKKKFKFFTRATKEGYFKTTVINNVKPVEKKEQKPAEEVKEVKAEEVKELAEPVKEEPAAVTETVEEPAAEETPVEATEEQTEETAPENTETIAEEATETATEEVAEEPAAEEAPAEETVEKQTEEVTDETAAEEAAPAEAVEEQVEEADETAEEATEELNSSECEEAPEAEVEVIAPETESVSEPYEKEDAFNLNAIKKTIDEKYELLDEKDKNYYNDILAYADEKKDVKRTKSLVAETVIYGRDSIIKVQIKQSKVVCSFSMLTTETKQRFIDENIKQVREKLTVVRITDDETFGLAKHCVDLAYRISEENKEAKHQKQLEKRREARRAKKEAEAE